MSKILARRLGDVCQVINGRAYKQSELLDDGTYKVLRVGNFFTNNSWYFSDLELDEDKYCDFGDLLFAWSASFGPRIWEGDKTIYHYHIWKMVPDSNSLDKMYLYYYLLNKTKTFISSTHGSIMLHLTKSFMEDLIVVYPEDLPTQKSIAKVLSDLDAKIELNNKINSELEAMAKTLYDYWFVQFDFPTPSPLGRAGVGLPYKSSGGKMVYNAELKREIPEGWEAGTLGKIAELVRGVTYDSSEIKDENDEDTIPVLRATNITGNVIDLDNMVYVPKQNVSKIQLLNRFDILITMSSGSKEHIGKNGFYYFDKEVSFGAFCAKIVAKKDFRYYLYSYTQSEFMFATIKNECLGTNINNLNGSLVKGFKLVLPPIELVKKFNEKVQSIYETIGNNHKQNQQLTALRDWLLPMLMNGQVVYRGSTTYEGAKESKVYNISGNDTLSMVAED